MELSELQKDQRAHLLFKFLIKSVVKHGAARLWNCSQAGCPFWGHTVLLHVHFSVMAMLCLTSNRARAGCKWLPSNWREKIHLCKIISWKQLTARHSNINKRASCLNIKTLWHAHEITPQVRAYKKCPVYQHFHTIVLSPPVLGLAQ